MVFVAIWIFKIRKNLLAYVHRANMHHCADFSQIGKSIAVIL